MGIFLLPLLSLILLSGCSGSSPEAIQASLTGHWIADSVISYSGEKQIEASEISLPIELADGQIFHCGLPRENGLKFEILEGGSGDYIFQVEEPEKITESVLILVDSDHFIQKLPSHKDSSLINHWHNRRVSKQEWDALCNEKMGRFAPGWKPK